MKKFLSFLFVFSILFLFLNKPIFAAENFSTNYNLTYNVTEDGLTNVSINVGLTNTTTRFYASSYKINVGFDDIQNITASDPDGKITPKITKKESGSEIEIDFNAIVVGLDKTLKFNLTFDTNQVAYKHGNIWEINIPGILDQDNFQNFNVHVNVPKSFGQPSYIKPPIESKDLNFSKEELGKSGISIGFGNEQYYSFNLKYHLANDKLFPIKTEVAIPMSTNYQDVYIEKIEPKPNNVTIDKDGNWLAEYTLSNSQKLDVLVRGKAQVYLYPRKEPLSEKELEVFLKEKPYWDVLDANIQRLAKELKTPSAIYEYVSRNLTYDFSRVTQSKPRLGAKDTLKNPQSAVCLEFTDLFIALARAAGIPAREVDGFAYTKNEKQRPLSLVKDVLHAWPEYYDKNLQTWIMVDPTWGNTTHNIDYFSMLDFDHFAFVIRGVNSSYPIPAGGYKLAGQENLKDIEVGLANEQPKAIENFEIKENLPNFNLSGLPIQGSIVLKNLGNSLLSSQKVNVQTRSLTPNSQEVLFEQIPPFGFLVKSVSFDKTPFLTNKKASIKMTVGTKSVSKTINIAPIQINAFSILAGGVFIAGIFTIIIWLIARRTRYLSFLKPKEQDSLYRQGEKSKK